MKKDFTKNIRYCIVLLISFIFVKEIYCGTTGNFLKIGVGARNIAMGETGATTEGVNSIYWNPSGLANIDKKEISFMHSVWFETINYDNISFCLPTKYGKFGVSLNYLSMSEMEKYDNTGVLQQDNMTAYDLAVVISYAMKLQDYVKYPLDFGYNIKVINSKLEEEQATTFGIDLGVKSNFTLGFISEKVKEENIDIGFVIQNISPGMKFIKETSSLPTNIKLGFSYLVAVNKERPLVCNLDINLPLEGDVKIGLGLEYNLRQTFWKDKPYITFSPRIGFGAYNKGLEEGINGLTAGLGIGYDKYNFDYAFVPYGELGQTHRISLSVKF